MNPSGLGLARGSRLGTAAVTAPESATISLGQKILREIQQPVSPEMGAFPAWFSSYLEELRLESDPELLYQGLLGAAQRLKDQSQDLSAQKIYLHLSQAELPASVRETAQRELSAWSGGSFGIRSEFLLSRFCGQATDWRVIAPMLAAGLVGRFAGTMALGRFTAMTARGSLPFVAEGLGVRLAAGTVGYLAEVPTFAALSRTLAPLPSGNFSQDLARSALSLGALKVFGGLGQGAAAWLRPVGRPAGFSTLLVTQTAALGGLMVAHQVEARFGLRPHADGGSVFMDSLAALFSLGVGARLGHRMLGEKFAGAHRDLEMRARLLQSRPLATSSDLPLAGGFALATGPMRFRNRGSDPVQRGPWLMMSNSNDGNGKKGDSLVPVELGTSLVPVEKPSIVVDPSLFQDPNIGRVLDGRYRIEALLGRGGMGKVYLATHEILGKKFAVKVLHESIASEYESTERFLTEAKSASAIGNPHIVDISDFGHLPEGSTYFVMEYLNGTPLTRLVDGEQPVPLPRMLNIAIQLTEGLGAAHRAGIVHRDLKPDNIFLANPGTEQEFVKILDFGIAKILNSDRKLTLDGRTLGSVHYMSPEQATAVELDQRSDIYAMGILLYEMASGKVPFNSVNRMEVMRKQLVDDPPPLAEVTSQTIPKSLEALILKSMQKDPDRRYQSMEELGRDLVRIQGHLKPALVLRPHQETQIVRLRSEKVSDTVIVPEPARRRWPLILGLSGGILGTMAASVGILVSRSYSQAPVDALPPPPLDAVTPPPPDAIEAVVIPDTRPVLKDVKLSVFPVDAHIHRNGVDLGSRQVVIALEEGTRIEIEVRRRGFKTKKIFVDGLQDKMTVSLERETGPKRPPPPKDPPPKKPPDGEVISPWK